MVINLHLRNVKGTHVLVLEAGEDFDFPQRALAIRLVLERGDLLDCHLCLCDAIKRRPGRGCGY